jgi:hypothetical protein
VIKDTIVASIARSRIFLSKGAVNNHAGPSKKNIAIHVGAIANSNTINEANGWDILNNSDSLD